MGGDGERPVLARFPIKGPLGISFSAVDAASPPLISAISTTGLAATVPGLAVGMALVSVQGQPVERAGFDAAIAAIKCSSRPLELEFARIGGDGSGAPETDSGSFDSTSSAGITELMKAAATGRDAVVVALRNSADLDAQDSEGWTALHHACNAGDKDSVEELLRAGCATDVEDAIGETAADIAESAGHSSLIGLMQQHAESAESGHFDNASLADSQLPTTSQEATRLERELECTQAELDDVKATLATERRCIQALTDQAHVGRDEALATLLDELEIARTQLSVSQHQQRELQEKLREGSSGEGYERMRLRLRQVEEVLSDMEGRMADATRREEALEKASKTAKAKCDAAVSEAAAARAEVEHLDAKCRDQATKLQQLRRRHSAQKEAAKQDQQRATDEALAEGAAGWEAQYREQAEMVDTQGRKLRELSRQLAEHRVSKENAARDAGALRTENTQLRKTVSALETELKEHNAECRKAEQLQRALNSERERAKAAAAARNEQHELEVNAMKDEFIKQIQESDKRISQLTKQQGSSKRERTSDQTQHARGSNEGARGRGHRSRPHKVAGASARIGNPRQSPRRARAHAPARTSRSSPVAATPVQDTKTADVPTTPEPSRAQQLLEQAENYERKTKGIGREIKRIGRDARRQQRQLSPEGPSAHDRRQAAPNGSRRSVSASPAKARPVGSPPVVARAGSAGPCRASNSERQKRPSGSPARPTRNDHLSSAAEKQVERLYVSDIERREQWRAQRLAEQEAAEAKQVRATSRRRPVKEDEVKKRWNDIQGAQRRKAEWVAEQKLKEEEAEGKELAQHWIMSKGSAAGGKYHVEDGRDVGTRTQAWHNQKKAELQRKERELKRTQRQQERGSLGVPTMSKKSKAYTKDLNSDVIMRNEQFSEQRSAKLAEAKVTREEEQAKKQKETVTLSKTSANLVSQGRHKDTNVLSRNEAFEAARLERLAAAEYLQQKPAGGEGRPAPGRSAPDSSPEPVLAQRVLSPVRHFQYQQDTDQMLTPEEDSFARNEREAALIKSGNDEHSPTRAYSRVANFVSSIAGVNDSTAHSSVRQTPPTSTHAGSGSVFARGRASKQTSTPSRRQKLSPAASRTSPAGETAVAFGSTFSPKAEARTDEQASPRTVSNLRRASVHPDVATSVAREGEMTLGRRSPLGNRRPRQDSPVERSLRAARAGDSTPELAADAQQMRDDLSSLKGMFSQLEAVANGAEGTTVENSAATGPDEDDYW